ncbi:hypothetical protein R69608_05910 [Paraburkholderia nemoris]|jgi:Signal transduction histidine kinase|uniref:Uncharacterized protein n=1 Tax=Paraburkholderia nemoris TaxID=2793076 RepID=A0ABM8SR79_9BURK|nr:hypothetical protein R75777_05961 [Paraburkholderia nemoris]CAE6826535.1 hypothetical protein R69776_06400 [Paraburkholderia nemoris]CAE6832987.1 hypothetical protein LMG22931_06892 [Paraburkholderia nemoris]CAE6952609.1 hypothetical protein R69608_05910 [Paraburkholderia nemoris]
MLKTVADEPSQLRNGGCGRALIRRFSWSQRHYSGRPTLQKDFVVQLSLEKRSASRLRLKRLSDRAFGDARLPPRQALGALRAPWPGHTRNDCAKSFGLVGMGESALMLGGKIVVHSAPVSDTSIAVRIPADDEAHHQADGLTHTSDATPYPPPPGV